jgi:hypothetical protein
LSAEWEREKTAARPGTDVEKTWMKTLLGEMPGRRIVERHAGEWADWIKVRGF